jgi:hypothetical protein
MLAKNMNFGSLATPPPAGPDTQSPRMKFLTYAQNLLPNLSRVRLRKHDVLYQNRDNVGGIRNFCYDVTSGEIGCTLRVGAIPL